MFIAIGVDLIVEKLLINDSGIILYFSNQWCTSYEFFSYSEHNRLHQQNRPYRGFCKCNAFWSITILIPKTTVFSYT